jgi:Pentapeptide repeats (8 copies)
MASSETSPSGQAPTRPWREWITTTGGALTSIAAVAALIFTAVSVQQTRGQLQITEQGQITDRYNAAITNLGSHSVDVRLGGIYALQRLMEDSSRDQSTVVAVLCAFVRDRARSTPKPPPSPPTDVQAAVTVVGTRNAAHDGGRKTVIDLLGAQLARGRFDNDNLARADLTVADFTAAFLIGTHLEHANLNTANFTGADLAGAHLEHADLTTAYLTGADLEFAYLNGANLDGANLNGAILWVSQFLRAGY